LASFARSNGSLRPFLGRRFSNLLPDGRQGSIAIDLKGVPLSRFPLFWLFTGVLKLPSKPACCYSDRLLNRSSSLPSRSIDRQSQKRHSPSLVAITVPDTLRANGYGMQLRKNGLAPKILSLKIAAKDDVIQIADFS
jgi:hypothetical protein